MSTFVGVVCLVKNINDGYNSVPWVAKRRVAKAANVKIILTFK